MSFYPTPASPTHHLRPTRRVNDVRRERRLLAARLSRQAVRRAWWPLGRFALPLVGVLCAVSAFLGPGSSAEAMESAGTYRILAGDTLYAIARTTGVPVADLVQINSLANPDFIVAGQVLQLDSATTQAGRGYVVQPGDTLSGIALANGVSTDRLAALNGLSNLDFIRAGASLDLPSRGSQPGSILSRSRVETASVTWKGSPNYWAGRPHGGPIAIVLHTADGSMVGIDGEFATPRSRLSTHYGVGLDGSIHQYVELGDRAWGNGYTERGSVWPGPDGLSPNHLTVSIESEDLGSSYQSVTDAQYRATLEVSRLIVRAYPGIRYLVSHRAIAPETRHNDPGPRWIASGRFVAMADALGLKAIP